MIRRTLCALFAVLLLTPPAAALAGSGDGVDPSEVWNPDGSVRWDNLKSHGRFDVKINLGISLGIPWFHGGTKTIYDGSFTLKFIKYSTPSGDTVLVPGPLTFLVMAAFPDRLPPELRKGYGVGNLPIFASGSLLYLMRSGVLGDAMKELGNSIPDDVIRSYRSESDFWRDVLQGGVGIWTIGIKFPLALLKIFLDEGFVGAAMLLYDGDLKKPPLDPPGDNGGGGGGNNNNNNNPNPTPNPRRNPRPTPPPSADQCPPPEVVRAPPAIEPLISRPPYPVVVGQDPERLGVIYEMTVRVPPVIYRRWERDPDICVPVPDADQDGRPDRGGSCWTTIGDPPVTWPGDLRPGGCRLVEERYADPIDGEGLLMMTLRPSSREWIEGELAQRYPGARVRMPEIRLPITGASEILEDKTCILRASVNPKPVDPGIYDVEFIFYTSGTPVSDPIEVRRRIEQKVWLMESTIVR